MIPRTLVTPGLLDFFFSSFIADPVSPRSPSELEWLGGGGEWEDEDCDGESVAS